jgi:hypothetical protein
MPRGSWSVPTSTLSNCAITHFSSSTPVCKDHTSIPHRMVGYNVGLDCEELDINAEARIA